MTPRATITAAIFAAAILRAPVVLAGDPTPTELLVARDLFAKAEKHEEAGQWQAAIEKLRRAASVKMTPGLRFHIGLCEEKLGQLVAALNDYTAAEAQAREGGNSDVLDALSEPLVGLRARIPTLTIKVARDGSDAHILLDGSPVPSGLWATAMPVDPGDHRVEATAPGRPAFTLTVVTREHDAKVVEVTLADAASPSSPAPQPARGTGPFHAGALVATAGAVVLGAAGVGSFLFAGAKQSDARAACASLVSCDDLKGPIRTFDWLALSAWVGAAALGTVAVVWWASPTVAIPNTDGRAGLVVGPGSVGLRGAF